MRPSDESDPVLIAMMTCVSYDNSYEGFDPNRVIAAACKVGDLFVTDTTGAIGIIVSNELVTWPSGQRFVEVKALFSHGIFPILSTKRLTVHKRAPR